MDEGKLSANKMRSLPRTNLRRMRRLIMIVGPIFCLLVCILQPAGAFLHCFTPNMFKMGKVGHPGGGGYPGSAHSGERANWYPQMGAYQSYGQNPMSRLFKPKWMGSGGSLFGPKRWMDWRMNAANTNYYRPNQFAYWPPVPPASFAPLPLPTSSLLGGKQGYNQFSDQLNLPSYSANNNAQQLLPATSGYNYNPANSYSQSQPLSQLNGGGGSGGGTTSTNSNDGWSYPSVSPYSRPGGQTGGQSSYGSDSYSVSPNNYQSAKQQLNQYGTKGGGGSGTKTAKK